MENKYFSMWQCECDMCNVYSLFIIIIAANHTDMSPEVVEFKHIGCGQYVIMSVDYRCCSDVILYSSVQYVKDVKVCSTSDTCCFCYTQR